MSEGSGQPDKNQGDHGGLVGRGSSRIPLVTPRLVEERDEARAQYAAECDSRRFAEGDRDDARRERDEARAALARVEQELSRWADSHVIHAVRAAIRGES